MTGSSQAFLDRGQCSGSCEAKVLEEFGPRTSSELWLGTHRMVYVSNKTRVEMEL